MAPFLSLAPMYATASKYLHRSNVVWWKSEKNQLTGRCAQKMLTMPDGYIDALCAGRNLHTITPLSRVVGWGERIPQITIPRKKLLRRPAVKVYTGVCMLQIGFFSCCCPSREIESGKLNPRKKRETQMFSKLFGNL